MLIWFRLAFWSALVFAFTFALLPQPPAVGDVGDKYQHMLAFGTLAVLAVAAYPATPLLRVTERLSFLGAMIELAQSVPALHRDCDILDWVTDTGAILGVMVVVLLWRRLRGAPATVQN